MSLKIMGFIPGQDWAVSTLIIGGDEDAVKQYWHIFKSVGKNIFHLGGIGIGQAYKLVSNLAEFGFGTLFNCECLNLGLKAGLDLKKMIEVMNVNAGARAIYRSERLNIETRKLIKVNVGDNAPQKDVATKDKELAMEMAKAVVAKC